MRRWSRTLHAVAHPLRLFALVLLTIG